MGDLSPHFSRSEFRDHSDGSLVGPDPKLIQVLERLRATDNRPLPVVSGYRSVAHNRAISGAKRSQHLYGRAADVPRAGFELSKRSRLALLGLVTATAGSFMSTFAHLLHL